MVDCPSVKNVSGSYTDNDDSYFICEIQEEATTMSSPKSRPYADLYWRCRLDTAADVIPVSVYKNASKCRPMQAHLKVYNSTNTTITGSCVWHHNSQSLTFSITNLLGSVLLRCADTLTMFVATTEKLNKKLPSGTKLLTSQVDSYQGHTINQGKMTVYHHLTYCHNLIHVTKLCTPNKILWVCS